MDAGGPVQAPRSSTITFANAAGKSLVLLLQVTDAHGRGNKHPLERSKYFRYIKCGKTPLSTLRAHTVRRYALGAERHAASTFASKA